MLALQWSLVILVSYRSLIRLKLPPVHSTEVDGSATGNGNDTVKQRKQYMQDESKRVVKEARSTVFLNRDNNSGIRYAICSCTVTRGAVLHLILHNIIILAGIKLCHLIHCILLFNKNKILNNQVPSRWYSYNKNLPYLFTRKYN